MLPYFKRQSRISVYCSGLYAQFRCKIHSASNDNIQQDTKRANISVYSEILDAALKHVSTKGWTYEALVAGAHDMKLSPAVLGIDARPDCALVNHFVSQCNQKLKSELQRSHDYLQQFRTKERLFYALQFRLQMLEPYVDTWPLALSISARPDNIAQSAKLIFSMIDDVWYASGDKSVSLDWYSKRALLAGVYTSTELFMLTDGSPYFEDTWAVLQRRLGEMQTLEEQATKIPESVGASLKAVLGSLMPSNLLSRQEEISSQVAELPPDTLVIVHSTPENSSSALSSSPVGDSDKAPS